MYKSYAFKMNKIIYIIHLHTMKKRYKGSHGMKYCGIKYCHGNKCLLLPQRIEQYSQQPTIDLDHNNFYKLFTGKIRDLTQIINKVPIDQTKPHFVRKSFLEKWEPGIVIIKKNLTQVPLNSKKFGRAEHFFYSEDTSSNADQIVCAMEHLIDKSYKGLIKEINEGITSPNTKFSLSDESRICLNLLVQSSWVRSKGFRSEKIQILKQNKNDVAELMSKFLSVGKIPSENGDVVELDALMKEDLIRQQSDFLDVTNLEKEAQEIQCQTLTSEGFLESLLISSHQYRYNIRYNDKPVLISSDTPSFKSNSGFKMAITPTILVEMELEKSLFVKNGFGTFLDYKKNNEHIQSGEYQNHDTISQVTIKDVVDWNNDMCIKSVDHVFAPAGVQIKKQE